MLQVMNGTVTFRRQTKPADYEGKTVEVSLSFAVAEGADPEGVIAEVAAMAQRRAMVMLGLPETVEAALPAPAAEAKPRKAKPPIIIGEKREEPAAAVADPTDLSAAAPATASPADLDGAVTAAAVSSPSPADLTPVEEDVFSAAPPAEATVVSDKDILDAIGRKNAEIRNATKIRELIGQYVTFPGTAKDIAQDKRAAFLTALSALTA